MSETGNDMSTARSSLPVTQRPRDRLRDQIRLERELTDRVVAREAAAGRQPRPNGGASAAAGESRSGRDRCGDDHDRTGTRSRRPARSPIPPSSCSMGTTGRGGSPHRGRRWRRSRVPVTSPPFKSWRQPFPTTAQPSSTIGTTKQSTTIRERRSTTATSCRTRHRHRRGIALRSGCPSTYAKAARAIGRAGLSLAGAAAGAASAYCGAGGSAACRRAASVDREAS